MPDSLPVNHNREVEIKILQRSKELARQFYEVDHNLTAQERQRLSSAFKFKSALVPVAGLVSCFGGIIMPRYLQGRGIALVGKRIWGLQVFSGYFGLLVGEAIADRLYDRMAASGLDDAPNAAKSYRMLSRYPSRVASTYYERTSKDAKWIMKDPDQIDFTRVPQFPLNLVIHREQIPVGRIPHPQRRGQTGEEPGGQQRQQQQQQQPEQYGQESSSPRFNNAWSDSTDEDPFALEDDNDKANDVPQGDSWARIRAANSTSGRGTSWDRVERRTDAAPQPRRVPLESVPTLPNSPRKRSDQLPSEQDRTLADIAYTGLAGPAAATSGDQADQDEFDVFLEKERQGQGLQDDFSDSEKKWR